MQEREDDVVDGPECVPRCGIAVDADIGGFPLWQTTALPSGGCLYEGEHCGMKAEEICACKPPKQFLGGATSGFDCRCTGGAWQCFYAYGEQGGASCSCEIPESDPRDSGANDAPDDG